MDLELAGKWVLISGASQGIGAAVAERFAQERANLVLVARNVQRLDALAIRLSEQYGVSVRTRSIDLTEPGCVESLARDFPNVDILINNAGAIPGGDLWQVDEGRWRAGWELKVFGYINMTRAFYASMQARGGGVIVNNIGNAAENFDFDYVAGTAGNAALVAFTRAIGGRSLRDGIRVLGVNPGPVNTERVKALMAARSVSGNGAVGSPTQGKSLPGGRLAQADEVADLIVFLASGRSRQTTGVVLAVDGGLSSARSIA